VSNVHALVDFSICEMMLMFLFLILIQGAIAKIFVRRNNENIKKETYKNTLMLI